jgi:hypothetical protein
VQWITVNSGYMLARGMWSNDIGSLNKMAFKRYLLVI